MENRRHRIKILKLNALVLFVVIALVGTSFALTTGHSNQGPASKGIYSPFTNSGSYNLTIREKGLPTGHLWNDTLVNTYYEVTYSPVSSTSSTIHYILQNGSYTFTSASVGYADNATFNPGHPDAVTINGNNVTYSVYFNKTYTVTLDEKGLPSGMLWYAALTQQTYNYASFNLSTSDRAVVTAINGTWLASAAANGSYLADVNNSGVQYTDLQINGMSLTLNVTFTKEYYINFKESGLPAVNNWNITVANATAVNSGSYYSDVYQLINSTNYPLLEPNGTWYYSFKTSNAGYNPYPLSGTITISGSNVSVDVNFSTSLPQGYYYLNFTETGLNNEIWSVTVNGTIQSSNTSTISFAELNGTYSYTVSSGVSGYSSNPLSGTATVNGASSVVPIKFSLTHPPSPPIWAFAGAYATYKMTGYNSSGNINSNAQAKILSVNVANESVKGSVLFYNSTTSNIEYQNGSWANFFLWFDQQTLSELNNGTSFGPGSNVTTNVTVTTPAGTFHTDEMKMYTDIPGKYNKAYIDRHSGIMVEYDYINSTANVSMTITSTNINTTATHSYTTTFTESGLPSGTAWYVNLSNGVDSGAITGTSYSFSLVNGTYSYTIATADKTYGSSPSSGSFTVNGANKTESVIFTAISVYPPAWAFKGAYANYTFTQSNKTSTEHGYFYFKIISVNNNTQEVEIFTKAYNGTSTTDSYNNISWNEVFFAFNHTDLSMLNNGTVPSSFSGSTVKNDVTVSTPMGTFTTDGINVSLNSSSAGYENIYVDKQNGLAVYISVSNGTESITAGIASTNIPNTTHKAAPLSLSPVELYGAVGGVVVAVGIVAAFSVLRKRR